MMFRQVGGAFSLALFVYAGIFKANPLFLWIPVDLTLLSATLVVLFLTASRVQDGPAHGSVFLPVSLLVLLALAIPFASQSEYGQTKLLTLFTFSVVLALSPFYLLRTAIQIRKFIYSLIVFGAVATISILVNFDSSQTDYGRVALEGSDTIGTGRVLVAAALLLLILSIERNVAPLLKVVLWSASGCLFAVGLMTGSRGPVVAGVAAILVVVVFAPALKRHRGRIVLGLGTFFLVVLVLLVQSQNEGLQRILEFTSGDSAGVAETRELVWRGTIDLILQNPWGYGFGAFAEANIFGLDYPHNIVLEVFYELGWLGGLIFVCIFSVAFGMCVRNARDTNHVAILLLLNFSFFGALVSSDMNGSRLFIVMMFAAFVGRRRSATRLAVGQVQPEFRGADRRARSHTAFLRHRSS